MSSISWETMDEFWSREPGTGRGNFAMMKKLRSTSKEALGLEDRLLTLGSNALQYEFGMGLACPNLRI